MPINGPVFTGLLMAEFTAQGFTGPSLLQLSTSIGNGVGNYLVASSIYQGTGVGIGAGAGVGFGSVQGISGPVTGMNIFAMMTAVGFTGPQSIKLAMAVGNAFATLMASAVVTSACAGMAVGVGIGTITGTSGPLMAASILAMFTAVGFVGPQSPLLASALGIGICNSILTGIVTTAIVGAGFPPNPMTGVDIGYIS